MNPVLFTKNLRWLLHLTALTALVFAIGGLFLRPTLMGDDLTYWSFAFDLHERGLRAWQVKSFHDLRWPVWGVCWLLQGIIGPGFVSFYGQPLLYLAAGAALAFSLGRLTTNSLPIAWIAGVAFLFHPLLDSVCYRPMPDLSEGVWGAAAVLGWWTLMQADHSAAQRWLLAGLTGTAVFVAESNRVTGAFIVPVLIVCTLLYFRPRFPWLLAAGGVAALLYLGECGFYKWRFDDWAHSLHANMNNTENKGTTPIPLWYLPFRFVDSLWKGGPLAPAYCIVALVGIRAAWRTYGVLGRVLVLWFAILFMEYSCALQPVWPPRPLLRDADRFLAGLAVPLAILATIGLAAAFEMLARVAPTAAAWIRRKPVLTGALALIALCLLTSRPFTDLGPMLEMRRYMSGLPDGTKVFTHKAMREFAYLIDGRSARRFTWIAPNEILHRTDSLEAQAAQCDEFWYARKLVWLTTRKQLEKKKLTQQAALASYFTTPERDWRMTRALAKGDSPDLIFYQRRTPDMPPVTILDAQAPEFAGLIPPLPVEFSATSVERTWSVPPSLRGKLVRFDIDAASEHVEALTIRLRFRVGDKQIVEYVLKPYLYPGGSRDFFAMPIPANAESCSVQLRLAKGAKRVQFTGFRAVVDHPVP